MICDYIIRVIVYHSIVQLMCNTISSATPGLHNNIPAYNIFARGWVAQIRFCSLVVAKIFQGLGPTRRASSNGDRVWSWGGLTVISTTCISTFHLKQHKRLHVQLKTH